MPYASITLSALRTDLAERLDSQTYWVSAELTAAINEAIRTWQLFTGSWRTSITIATPAPASPWITIPLATMLYPMAVRFLTNPDMDRTSISTLNGFKPNWLAHRTDDGGSIPTTPRLWAPAGFGLIAIWPADHLTAQNLYVEGAANPAVLSADGDFIDMSEAEHDAVLQEAQFLSLFKLGGQALQLGAVLHKQFLTAALDKNDRLKRSSIFRKALGLDTDRAEAPLRPTITSAEILKARGVALDTQEIR